MRCNESQHVAELRERGLLSPVRRTLRSCGEPLGVTAGDRKRAPAAGQALSGDGPEVRLRMVLDGTPLLNEEELLP